MAYTPETNNSVPETNTILVNIVRLGSSPVAVELQEGATVGQAFDVAGLDRPENVSIRGSRFDMNAIVEDGDRLTVTQSVKGA